MTQGILFARADEADYWEMVYSSFQHFLAIDFLNASEQTGVKLEWPYPALFRRACTLTAMVCKTFESRITRHSVELETDPECYDPSVFVAEVALKTKTRNALSEVFLFCRSHKGFRQRTPFLITSTEHNQLKYHSPEIQTAEFLIHHMMHLDHQHNLIHVAVPYIDRIIPIFHRLTQQANDFAANEGQSSIRTATIRWPQQQR